MKTLVQRIYLVILTLFILLPVLFFSIFGRFLNSSTASMENRTLASMPSLSDTELSEFPAAFDNYFNDNLPYKNELVRLNSKLDYFLLHTSPSKNVLVGDDGWLFYIGQQVNNENPLEDYAGTNLYTDEELLQIAANMVNTRDYLAYFGKDFVITMLPNKSRVYDEYMPDLCGEANENCRMMQVYNYLIQNTDLKVVLPYTDIMAYKEAHPETQLYFKYDTHWNNLGAYLAARATSAQLGFDMPPLENLEIKTVGSDTYDLARMINLGDELKEEAPMAIGYTVHGAKIDILNNGLKFTGTVESLAADPRRMFMIGDSFAALLFPYMASNFNYSMSDMYYEYSYEELCDFNPDIVVFEVVERYMDNMLHFSIREGVEAY